MPHIVDQVVRSPGHCLDDGTRAIIQQGGVDPGPHLDAVSRPGDQAEMEADRGAEAAVSPDERTPVTTPVSGRAGTTVHRADDDWDNAYGTHKSFLQLPFELFKAGVGEIRATTAGGLKENKGRPLTARPKGTPTGTPAASSITVDVLKEIYAGLGAGVTADPAKARQAETYCKHLNTAFKIMKIDTVEAQVVVRYM